MYCKVRSEREIYRFRNFLFIFWFSRTSQFTVPMSDFWKYFNIFNKLLLLSNFLYEIVIQGSLMRLLQYFASSQVKNVLSNDNNIRNSLRYGLFLLNFHDLFIHMQKETRLKRECTKFEFHFIVCLFCWQSTNKNWFCTVCHSLSWLRLKISLNMCLNFPAAFPALNYRARPIFVSRQFPWKKWAVRPQTAWCTANTTTLQPLQNFKPVW